MNKTTNPYLRLWLALVICLLCVFSFSFAISQLGSLKIQEKLLKQSLKTNKILLLNELNKKLNFLSLNIEQIKQQEIISSESPFRKLIILQKDQIEKIYSNSLEIKEEKQLKDIKKKQNTISSKKNKRQILLKKEKNLNQLKKIIADIPLDKILKNKSKIHFINIKEKNKNQLIGIRSVDKNQTELIFFKKDSDFFKTSIPNIDIYFTAVTYENLTIFYNKLIKKSRRAQILELFTKKESKASKYIRIKRKKSALTDFYYLNKWKIADLYIIIQSKNSGLISSSIFSKQLKFFWILVLSVILFLVSLFLFWKRLSTLFSAYSFLKSAIISNYNTGSFPISQSKNPLLYFYNNRTALFKIEKPEEIKEESKSQTFQSLIKKELETLKLSYPKLSINEDYQSNVKLFGNTRFLKTVVHELLLNSLEAMGIMEIQKIDLSLSEDKNNIVFCICDYGIGLKDTKKAFEMYHSTKSQLGVGLNLVESIVKAKGGQIKLQPLEKGGVKATVSFPLKIFLKQY